MRWNEKKRRVPDLHVEKEKNDAPERVRISPRLYGSTYPIEDPTQKEKEKNKTHINK